MTEEVFKAQFAAMRAGMDALEVISRANLFPATVPVITPPEPPIVVTPPIVEPPPIDTPTVVIPPVVEPPIVTTPGMDLSKLPAVKVARLRGTPTGCFVDIERFPGAGTYAAMKCLPDGTLLHEGKDSGNADNHPASSLPEWNTQTKSYQWTEPVYPGLFLSLGRAGQGTFRILAFDKMLPFQGFMAGLMDAQTEMSMVPSQLAALTPAMPADSDNCPVIHADGTLCEHVVLANSHGDPADTVLARCIGISEVITLSTAEYVPEGKVLFQPDFGKKLSIQAVPLQSGTIPGAEASCFEFACSDGDPANAFRVQFLRCERNLSAVMQGQKHLHLPFGDWGRSLWQPTGLDMGGQAGGSVVFRPGASVDIAQGVLKYSFFGDAHLQDRRGRYLFLMPEGDCITNNAFFNDQQDLPTGSGTCVAVLVAGSQMQVTQWKDGKQVGNTPVTDNWRPFHRVPPESGNPATWLSEWGLNGTDCDEDYPHEFRYYVSSTQIAVYENGRLMLCWKLPVPLTGRIVIGEAFWLYHTAELFSEEGHPGQPGAFRLQEHYLQRIAGNVAVSGIAPWHLHSPIIEQLPLSYLFPAEI